MLRRHVLAGLLALASLPAAAKETVSDAPVWSGDYANDREPGVTVVRDPKEWVSLWKFMLQANPPQPLPPGFAGVVVRLGPRRTGGYGVEILGHAGRECAYVVTYAEHEPAPGAFVTQAFTSPWAIALVPAGDRPVVLERAEKDGSRRIVIPPSEARRLAQSGEACLGRLRQP